MNPVILEVKEGVRLGAGSVPVQVLLVKWSAGPYGPFTEQSSWEALNNGTLMDILRAKTLKLGLLPAPSANA